MPRLYQRTARKDIYDNGKRTKAKNKQGYTLDRSKPSGPTDIIVVKKGQQYYTWHPKGSGWQVSLHRPDLRSAWDQEFGSFQDRVDAVVDAENDGTYEDGEVDNKEELQTEIEERRDELQNNLDAMPEQLQESSVLNERIEELDNLLNDLG